MRNFYYLQSFNLANPLVRAFISNSNLDVSMFTDIKFTSKPFLSLSETVKSANESFITLYQKIYKDETQAKKFAIMNIVNPIYVDMANFSNDEAEATGDWDKECYSTIFFCDVEEETNDDVIPKTWLVRYEIRFADDNIELVSKNGVALFDPAAMAFNNFTSSIH